MRTISFILAMIFPAMLAAAPARIPENGDEKWATVRGQIVFDGDVPQPNGIVDRNGKPLRQVQNWIIHPKTKGVKNVFVWISSDADKAGMRMPIDLIHPDLRKVPKNTIEIDNTDMEYTTHSIGARHGQSLTFKNTSTEAVNLRYQGLVLSGNLLIMVGKDHTIAELKAEAVPLILNDTLHPWMLCPSLRAPLFRRHR